MKKKILIRLIYNICVLAVLAAGAWLVVDHFLQFEEGEYTDNATVQQHITPVNARVGGFIKEIRFNEYQPVHKGDTLVVIEDSEYRLQLAQAEANLQRELAGGDVTSSTIGVTRQNMSVSDAGVDEASVRLENARIDDQRYAQLLKSDAVTQQQYDKVHTAYLEAQARYEQAVRSRGTLAKTETEQGHRLTQNQAAVKVARAQIQLAKLNLSYTVIIATADGVVGKKDIHVGQLVQPGQTMASIVDNSELWVVANYRETQLPNIHVGSKVDITVDAVPGVAFKGTVERISDALRHKLPIHGVRRCPCSVSVLWCGIQGHGGAHQRCHRLCLLNDSARQCHRQFRESGATHTRQNPPRRRQESAEQTPCRHECGVCD